ncbi:MAG: YeeE/YedE thiosulfate transporter family protein [Rhodovibrionaceae bacterium]|nr:YeeE/YedE thiosulfate transporter family protein [Rhodovibrionaceae bacterium]
MHGEPRPFWHPLAAGVLLGLVLLLTFLVTGHGLGASGFFTRLAAAVGGWLAPAASAANAYLGPYVGGASLAGWITWEILGVFLGGLIGSLWSGRFRLGVEGGRSQPTGRRLAYAFLGGILVGFGSRLARGCTSGLGLSGGAVLSVGGFLFLAGFFAAGLLVMQAMRKEWS